MIQTLRQLLLTARADPNLLVEGIHSIQIFRSFLVHERAMAERFSYGVCVVAFPFTGAERTTRNARLFSRICANRLRTTDVIGWLDDTTAAVLLARTPVPGATLVADQIVRQMSEAGVELDYRIYSYPNDPPPGLPPSSSGGTRPPAATPEPGEAPAAPPPAVPPPLPPLALDDLYARPLPAWKRAADLLLALIALVLLAPLMALIALFIQIVSPGPIFFCQERVGFLGRRFMLYKFRSMKPATSQRTHEQHLAKLIRDDATLAKLDHRDTRLIPLGKIFRASALDELPQLFNVLRGDMSFIGPRPCVPYEYDKFDTWHRSRCLAYPGLTGLWQVSGKNKTTFTEMMRLDNAYARRPTAWRDLRILLLTLPVVWQQICETADRKGTESA
jgi:lipopolysaccharide/colanic/teichoic acid biosynthesis glycosyltransferase